MYKKSFFISLSIFLLLTGCVTIGPPVTTKEIDDAKKELKARAYKFKIEKELEVAAVGLNILQHLPPEDRKGEYPYLGLSCRNINGFLRDIYGFSKYENGVVVVGTVPGAPVSECIEDGDIIFKIDGCRVHDTHALSNMVSHLKPGSEVNIIARRNGEEISCNTRTLIVPFNVGFGIGDMQTINASASPGKVSVTYGMLRFIKSDDELGVVIGHELAHLTRGHILKNMGTGVVAGIGGVLLGVGAEVLAPGSGGAVSDITGGAFDARFSRDFEREADYYGLKYAYLAGYNIDAGKDIWERFAIEAPRSMSRDFFSTHPGSPERMLRLKKIAEELKR